MEFEGDWTNGWNGEAIATGEREGWNKDTARIRGEKVEEKAR